jgi:hypothetical protein
VNDNNGHSGEGAAGGGLAGLCGGEIIKNWQKGAGADRHGQRPGETAEITA